MIDSTMKVLLSMSLWGGLIALFLFAIKPFIKDKVSRSWQYYIWLMVIMRFLISFSFEINFTKTVMQHYEQMRMPTEYRLAESTPATGKTGEITEESNFYTFEANETKNIEPGTKAKMNLFDLIKNSAMPIWFVIALMLFVKKVTSYSSFVHYMKAGRRIVKQGEVLNLFHTTCTQLGMKKAPELYTNRLVSSAMLVGIFRPFVVIPEKQLADEHLKYVFLHELSHLKRFDIQYKWLVQLLVCVHWFNPIVYFISREINNVCEFACDEYVLTQTKGKDKKSYGDTLISSLEFGGIYSNEVLTLTLCESGHLLKERLDAIVAYGKKSKFGTAITFVLTAFIFTGAVCTGTYGSNEPKKDIQVTAGSGVTINEQGKDVTSKGMITFGQYEGQTLEWRILDVKEAGGRQEAVLFLEKTLPGVEKAFSAYGNVWADSAVRKWLNGTEKGEFFSDENFTEQEKAAIIDVEVEQNAIDKVFSISKEEYEIYGVNHMTNADRNTFYWTRSPEGLENIWFFSTNNQTNGAYSFSNELAIRPMMKIALGTEQFKRVENQAEQSKEEHAQAREYETINIDIKSLDNEVVFNGMHYYVTYGPFYGVSDDYIVYDLKNGNDSDFMIATSPEIVNGAFNNQFVPASSKGRFKILTDSKGYYYIRLGGGKASAIQNMQGTIQIPTYEIKDSQAGLLPRELQNGQNPSNAAGAVQQAAEPGIASKDINSTEIQVDIETLEPNQIVNLGRFDIQEGDRTWFDIKGDFEEKSERDTIIFIGYSKEEKYAFGGTSYYMTSNFGTDALKGNTGSQQEGTFYLWIGNQSGVPYKNVKGTVAIGKNNDR